MDIEKIILVYLCMAISVSMFFPTIVLDSGNTSILGIFHVNLNSTTNEVTFENSASFTDNELNTAVNTADTDGSIFATIGNYASQFFQSIVDGLKNVLGVIKIMGKFLFSPVLFLGSADLLGDAPIYVKLIFALPLILMAFFGLTKFVRGFQG